MNAQHPTGSMNNLEENIRLKIAAIDEIAEDIPGVVIINNISTLKVEYMSPRGLRDLGLTLEEVRELTYVEYHDKYFNPEDAKDYVPKIFGLMERNNNRESISFFQQVRTKEDGSFQWHFSSMKLLLWDDENKPAFTITIAFPIDPLNHITRKVTRLLEENNFLRKNYERFARLGKREREILRLMALRKTKTEIAELLFISPATAETHKRNIKQKLGIKSSHEISLYAQAFDLI
jgi:DNA-binding CsgD family transcriptional regulator